MFPFYSSAITDKLPWIAETKTCILPMITELSGGYFRLYRSYKVGVLPLKGALFDQPEKYLKAMDLIQTHIIEPSINDGYTS